MPSRVSVTPDIANHVLHYFRKGGYPAGSFTEALLRAIAAADQENRGRLSLGFPGYVLAMNLAQYDEDGLDLLAKWAVLPGGSDHA